MSAQNTLGLSTDPVKPAPHPDPVDARYELQQARAGLEDTLRHLQRAARSAGAIYRPAFATAIADTDYARDRVVRILKHLAALEGGR